MASCALLVKETGTIYVQRIEGVAQVHIIDLLQLAITWYKIRHAGGQAHYYSRTGKLKQGDLNQ